MDCLHWWHTILSTPCTARSLSPRPHVNPDLWVNASMGWGISMVMGIQWAAWKLIPGWKMGGRDINWAESVALELAVLLQVECGYSDCLITIQGDNTGVIGAFDKGRSRSIPHNDSIRHISAVVTPCNITIRPIYMASTVNRADPVSHGILGSSALHVTRSLVLPL